MQPDDWNSKKSKDVLQQSHHWLGLVSKYEALSGEKLTDAMNVTLALCAALSENSPFFSGGEPLQSQKSAAQNNGATKFGINNFGRGVAKVFVPDATKFGTIKQMRHNRFFIVCLATIATISVMTVQWLHTCWGKTCSWQGGWWHKLEQVRKSATEAIDLPTHKRSIRIVYFMWSLVKVLTHERTPKRSLWQQNRCARAEPLMRSH